MFTKQNIKEYLIITGGTGIVALAVYCFMIPSHVSVGSASALAMVLSNFIPLPISVISFVINAVLLVLGFLLIGSEFGAKTVYTTMLLPVMIGILEILLPNFQSLTEDPLLDVVCYIMVVNVGLAILFSRNASSGGLDIIAKIMNKFFRIDLGQAMAIPGIIVALSSALVYDKKIVVLSVLGTYFGGIVLDNFIFGINIKRRVCILSQKHDEILHFILHELHSGATIYEGLGAFSRNCQQEIATIVDKQEYRQLMDYIRKTDPAAFVTVIAVNEINYLPKDKTLS